MTVDDFWRRRSQEVIRLPQDFSSIAGTMHERRNDARILDSIAQEKEPIALCLVENFNFPTC